ncbi:MAG: DUF2846 domain-containing protein [Betaproteobacteria bacterium]|nr:DUF2846 domain-containing protein [Betaproteobacteria bacterium]
MRLLFILLLLFLTACATTPYKSDGPPFTNLATPVADAALVYLIRPPNEIGSAIWPNVYVDESRVADLKNGTFTIVHLRPGTYKIRTVKDPQFFLAQDWNSETQISVEAGQLYFVECYMETRTWRGITLVGTSVYPTENFEVLKNGLRLLPQPDAVALLQALRFEGPVIQTFP